MCVRTDHAVTTFRHDPCEAAHNVPLRVWCCNALPILAASRLVPSPCYAPPPPLAHMLRSVSGSSGRDRQERQPVRQRLRLFVRATVIGNADGGCTRLQDPGPSHLLLGEKSSKCAGPPCGTPRGRGVLVSLSPAAVPGGPDTYHASKAVMVCASSPGAHAPSMRQLHRAKRWRRLVAGSPRQVGVPRCRALRDFFESLTGSPHALSAAAGTARPASRHSAASSRAVRSSSRLRVTRRILWPS